MWTMWCRQNLDQTGLDRIVHFGLLIIHGSVFGFLGFQIFSGLSLIWMVIKWS